MEEDENAIKVRETINSKKTTKELLKRCTSKSFRREAGEKPPREVGKRVRVTLKSQNNL